MLSWKPAHHVPRSLTSSQLTSARQKKQNMRLIKPFIISTNLIPLRVISNGCSSSHHALGPWQETQRNTFIHLHRVLPVFFHATCSVCFSLCWVCCYCYLIHLALDFTNCLGPSTTCTSLLREIHAFKYTETTECLLILSIVSLTVSIESVYLVRYNRMVGLHLGIATAQTNLHRNH